jgi:hypothetical protein
MSQAGIANIQSSHPQIPTSFITNSGTATPIGNVLEILGTTVAAHSIPLETTGSTNIVTIVVQYASAAASSVGNNAGVASFNNEDFNVDANGFVSIANTFNGTGTTVGATTANIITIPLGGVAGTYQFEARVAAFESGTPSSAGYNLYGTFRTDGTTATLIGNQDIFNEDAALNAANAYFIASGNNAVLQVLGVTGLTIAWVAETELTISL